MKAGSFDAGDEKPEKKPVMNGSDSGETGTTATPSPKKGGRGNGKKRGRPVKEVYNDYDGDGNGNEEWMEGTPKKPRNGSTGGDRRAKVRVEKPVVEEDEGSDGAFGESIYV